MRPYFPEMVPQSAEHKRISTTEEYSKWAFWGPYLSERQWGTVREDYSEYGSAWDFFPHDHARSRVYRWGEDGIAGISDEEQRLCLALSFWNGKDSILKERLFGLTAQQGNHNEDVKELYFYKYNLPSHAYMQYRYLYPVQSYPYAELVTKNAERTHMDPEYELMDTASFAQGGYFDIDIEYAKADPYRLVLRVTVQNCSSLSSPFWCIPQLWFRNTWLWGNTHPKPCVYAQGSGIRAEHNELGNYILSAHTSTKVEMLFTENESNAEELYDMPNVQPYTKDSFHRYLIKQEAGAVNPLHKGTKSAMSCFVELAPGETHTFEFELAKEGSQNTADRHSVLHTRRQEALDFYLQVFGNQDPKVQKVAAEAASGLMWGKQYYEYDVYRWLKGDEGQYPPPASRWRGRNSDWKHLHNKHIISMPDKWEYPWYASWDVAFHAIAIATIDPILARDQLLLFLRSNYIHPSGQIPAYEWAFSDVNPPITPYAIAQCKSLLSTEMYEQIVEEAYVPLVRNFDWWIHKICAGSSKYLFKGGFMGLDNVSVLDRGAPLPKGIELIQADTTSWVANYALCMIEFTLVRASANPFLENELRHYVYFFREIIMALHDEENGLWDKDELFYFDTLVGGDMPQPLKVYNVVGLLPLVATRFFERTNTAGFEALEATVMDTLTKFPDLKDHFHVEDKGILLSLTGRQRALHLWEYLFDSSHFLGRYGIRSLSVVHRFLPYSIQVGDYIHSIQYAPDESPTTLFGENSNWRGPIWFPVNYALLQALKEWSKAYPHMVVPQTSESIPYLYTLEQWYDHITQRLLSLFVADDQGIAPSLGQHQGQQTQHIYRTDLLFYEYFNPDTGRGMGASHQTGWTALIIALLKG